VLGLALGIWIGSPRRPKPQCPATLLDAQCVKAEGHDGEHSSFPFDRSTPDRENERG
jgi:hypothetical protein